MDYEPNRINWNTDDLVIHDADEKSEKYLMQVIEIDREDGLVKTKYANRKGNEPYYLNRLDVLHDPTRFGIAIGGAYT